MVRDMVRNYGLITVAEAYPNETQKHHNGGQLWYWTQLGSVLQHFGDGDHFTKLMAKDQYYMRVLRTAIFKDVIDNFCTPGVDRILFQDFMLAFMSEVCGLLLKMMEDGYLSVSVRGGRVPEWARVCSSCNPGCNPSPVQLGFMCAGLSRLCSVC